LGYSDIVWSNGATTDSILIVQAGSYSVQGLSSAGCVARDTVEVNFLPVPQIPNVQYEDPVCEGSTVQLNSPQAGGTVLWEGPNNFNQQGASVFITSIATNQSGTYYVSQETNGCRSDSASFELNVLEAPQIFLSGDTLICAEEFSLLTVGGDNQAVQWSTGETTVSIEVTAGNYSVFTTLENGCNDTLSIQVYDAEPSAQISPSEAITVLLNTPLSFTDSSYTPLGTEIESFIWDFEGSEESGPEITVSFSDTGLVNLIYTITNDAGCLDTLSTEILVIADVIVPNVFTPNGDGKNDFFVIQNLEAFDNAGLRIYTRWGRLIFQSENYINNWDGAEATDGTYFYILDVPLLEKKYEGTVTILR
jgi:gliding motility-associated-like protein